MTRPSLLAGPVDGVALDCRHRIQSLARGNGLGFTGSQTLSAIIRDGAVDNGAAIDAFPCIKHEKEIREPL